MYAIYVSQAKVGHAGAKTAALLDTLPDLEDIEADSGGVTSQDLALPLAAQALESSMFENTFMQEACSATMNGILSAGEKAPVIGVIFAIIKQMKVQYDLYAESSEECRRLSVWCVSLIATIGHLANEAVIDADTDRLLRAAVPPLLALKTLVVSRMETINGGYKGKFMAFFTSKEYLDKSQEAQKHVKSAIHSLTFRVQVNTRIDVQNVLKKCEMLPNMDQKIDHIVKLAKENSQKLDQVLKLATKQGAKEKTQHRRNDNMESYNISSAAVKKEDEAFASGSTCLVFMAMWERQPVAVKVVSLKGVPRHKRIKIAENVAIELGILVRLSHPNILNVYGIIDEDLDCLQLVMEFATEGELGDILRTSCDPLPVRQQIDWSLQVAAGMRYLHAQKVAHRDLKSLNILVSKNFEGNFLLKISDFGLSKEQVGATMSSGTATTLGTPQWSAPEILDPTSSTTLDYFKSDIWSYGVVVWEIGTRKMPFEGKNAMQVARSVADKGIKMQLSAQEGHHEPMISIVDACCHADPHSRLPFAKVIEILEEALEQP